MKLTTQLELQSQTTRLEEHVSYAANSELDTGFSPSLMPCFKRLQSRSHADYTSQLYNSIQPLGWPIFNLSSARFTRRYWGHHCYCLVLPLVICLNSGGNPTSDQIFIDGDIHTIVRILYTHTRYRRLDDSCYYYNIPELYIKWTIRSYTHSLRQRLKLKYREIYTILIHVTS